MLLDNPFHVLGLPADCTAKELTEREGRIRAYCGVGKPLLFDDDLLFPKCRRNEGTVNVAIRALQDAGLRTKAGLFWLTRSGLLDDAGFDILRNEGPLAALVHWNKVADRMPITEKYMSSVSNYASMCILIPLILPWDEMKETVVPLGFKTRQQLVYKGLELKSVLIGSTGDDVLRGFLVSVTDEMAGSDIERAVGQFGSGVKELVDECRKYGVTLAMSQVAKSLGKGGARCADLMGPFINEHRQQLAESLADCERSRDSNPADAVRSGKKLFAAAKSALKELRRIVGSEDILYLSLVDQVAEEVLQCAIDNFNFEDNRDGETLELAEAVEELVERAMTLEPQARVQSRLEQALDTIQSRKEDIRKKDILPDELGEWLARAVQMTEGHASSLSIVKFVEASIGRGRESTLNQLDRYRANALQAGVQSFELSEDYRVMCTMTCQMCVGLLVKAANDAHIGRDLVMQMSVPILDTMHSSFTASRTSVPSRTYPVDRQAYEHLTKNRQILKRNVEPVRRPSPPRHPRPTPTPVGGSGCMVAAAFLIAVFGLTFIALK